MGWYAKIYNHTRDEWSKNEYKYGRGCEVFSDMNWDTNDIVIGGGPDDEYIVLSGNVKLKQIYDYGFVIDYEIVT